MTMVSFPVGGSVGMRGVYKKQLATFVGADKASAAVIDLSKSEKKNRDSELVLFQVGTVKMCSLQRLALSILLLGASLQLSASWPNRLTRTTVCQDLHVTHPGQNLVLARGNVSLVLLKNGREVSCYEPEQEYEGMQRYKRTRESICRFERGRES